VIVRAGEMMIVSVKGFHFQISNSKRWNQNPDFYNRAKLFSFTNMADKFCADTYRRILSSTLSNLIFEKKTQSS